MNGFVVNDETRKQQRQAFEQRQKAGIAAPGEAPDIFQLVEGYNHLPPFEPSVA
jgi:hypothetical protein